MHLKNHKNWWQHWDMEKHHVVPISCGWENWTYNMILLNHNTHTMLHQTLDIQPHIFWKKIRNIRELFNHKTIVTPEQYEAIWELQHLFFENVSKLPPQLVRKNLNALKERFDTYSSSYKKITWDEYDMYDDVDNEDEQVKNVLNKTIDCQKEISKELIFIIQKHINA